MANKKKSRKGYEIISRVERYNQVAYLKRQEDGRYTINAGSKWDSGWDNWYSTEATSLAQAKAIFKHFIKIWFSETMDAEDKDEELSDMDLYIITPPDEYY